MSLVLFDFDFTLADSSAGAVECVNSALQELGFGSAPRNAVVRTIGLSLTSSFETLTGCTQPHIADRFSQLFAARAEEVMADLTNLYPYTKSVIRRLHQAEFRMAIVSTKFRRRIETVLTREDLSRYFDLVVGGEDVARHKPDPDSLILALDRLSVDPGDSVYVGDNPVDALAADAADIRFVATLSGTTDRESFMGLKTDAIISSLVDLPEALEDLFREKA